MPGAPAEFQFYLLKYIIMYTYSSRSNFSQCRVGVFYLQDASDHNNNINSVHKNELGVINAVVDVKLLKSL